MSGLGDRHILRVSRSEASQWLLLVLLTLPHLKPDYFEQIPSMDLFFNLWRVASFAVIIVRLVLIKQKISAVAALICIQQTFVFGVTLFNGGNIYTCAVLAFSITSVVLLYDGMRYDREVFLSSQLFCVELVIYINLITELLFPGGLYVEDVGFDRVTALNWFLGYYNQHSKFFIPALMFAWLYKETTGEKLRTYFLTCGIFISALLVWSGGVLMTLFGMAFAYVLLKNRTSLFHYYSYWSIHIFFFFFIVVLKIQNVFQWLIDGVLGKWKSLLVRMDLWDRTLKLISEAPLFGHGRFDPSTRELESGLTWARHAHNLLLETLYQGGLVNLVFWVVIVIVAGKKLYRYRNTMESKIIAIAFFGWCIATLVEPSIPPFLMGMFIVAYYSNKKVYSKQANMSGLNAVTLNENQQSLPSSCASGRQG